MANCEFQRLCSCVRESSQIVSPSMEYFLKRYCLGEKSLCARYVTFREFGKENVPKDLYPHQLGKAMRMTLGDH